MNIQKNINLAQYTTFKIGGLAKEFVVVKNENELIDALRYAKENKLKYYILAGGSNVFFDDRGFDGLVIKNEINICSVEGEKIICGAGAGLGEVVSLAKNSSLTGMESLAGIPGTIGGAVRGNAGAHGVEISDLVETVRYWDVNNGEMKELNANDCKFLYRDSIFKEKSGMIILLIILKLQAGNSEEIAQKMKEIVQKRVEKQPTGWVGCAGSFFENPTTEKREIIEKFERDTGVRCVNGKIAAGWLITEAGMRGKKIGGIEVSEKHANFVLNTGGGTAEEVVMLTSIIKQKVRTRFSIQLKEEVQYVAY